jgi:hypothetical protein
MVFTFLASDVMKVGLHASAANQFTYLGFTDDDTDTGLLENNTAIAGWQEDTRSKSGVVIYDPDSNFQKSSGKLKFDMPKDVADFRANVVIQGQGSRTTSSGAKSVSVNPLAVGLAVLDKNAPSTGNLIVVGGPCVNTKAAELMGSPANDCAVGFSEGEAIIKLYPGTQTALLVAGYSAADTQGASRVLADYESHLADFQGKTEVKVITASLSVTAR